MARKAISGARARRNVRIAQMAGLSLAVTAAALWALQVPGLEGPLPEKPTLRPVSMPEIKPPAAQAAPQDRETLLGVAARLEAGANIVRKDEGDKPGAPAVAAAAPAEWKYIAPIREPKRMLAVVGRDGKQKIMAAGREWGDAKLLSVNEREIVIEDEAGRHTIARGERNGPAVQWTKIAPNAPSASGGVPGDAAEAASMSKGIDGSQAAAIRQALQDKSRRRGVALPPAAMREFGLTREALEQMGEDEIQMYRDKFNTITRERGGARGETDADGADR